MQRAKLIWEFILVMIAIMIVIGALVGVLALSKSEPCPYTSAAECLANEGNPGYEHPRGS